MRYLALLTVFAISALFPLQTIAAESGPTCYIEDLGGGVLYFDCIGNNFGIALGKWAETHPELTIAAMTGDGNGTYGRDEGYFVVTQKRDQ
jgi:hypothetical protein